MTQNKVRNILCIYLAAILPVVWGGMCVMMFVFDFMFISVITVKVVVFISVFDMGPMPMIISIMNVNYLLK